MKVCKTEFDNYKNKIICDKTCPHNIGGICEKNHQTDVIPADQLLTVDEMFNEWKLKFHSIGYDKYECDKMMIIFAYIHKAQRNKLKG